MTTREVDEHVTREVETKEKGSDWITRQINALSLPFIVVAAFTLGMLYMSMSHRLEGVETWQLVHNNLSVDVAELKRTVGDLKAWQDSNGNLKTDVALIAKTSNDNEETLKEVTEVLRDIRVSLRDGNKK